MRIDLVFSYWIFVWYLLYIAKIVKSNPKLLILIGIIINTGLLIQMIVFGYRIQSILLFVLVNTIIKLIPYYSLRKTEIEISALIPASILFILYCFWLYYNHNYLTGNYLKIYDFIQLHLKNNNLTIK